MKEHFFDVKDGSACRLARRLLADGTATPDDRLTLTRDGAPALSGGVGWLAARTVQENAPGGLAFVHWRAFPDLRSDLGEPASAPDVE